MPTHCQHIYQSPQHQHPAPGLVQWEQHCFKDKSSTENLSGRRDTTVTSSKFSTIGTALFQCQKISVSGNVHIPPFQSQLCTYEGLDVREM